MPPKPVRWSDRNDPIILLGCGVTSGSGHFDFLPEGDISLIIRPIDSHGRGVILCEARRTQCYPPPALSPPSRIQMPANSLFLLLSASDYPQLSDGLFRQVTPHPLGPDGLPLIRCHTLPIGRMNWKVPGIYYNARLMADKLSQKGEEARPL